MQSKYEKTIPLRLHLSRFLIQSWPFNRGRQRIALLLLGKFLSWPERASFDFRFGRFVNVPLRPWPWGYRDLFLYGSIESDEVSMWSRVLKPGSNVVDGGANWGYWSLVASTVVGKNGQVHSFEPVPNACNGLRDNVKASCADNVTVHQAALSQESGTGIMHIMQNDPISGQSSLGVLGRNDLLEEEECRLAVLDDVIGELPLRLIKLDVEGGELDALKGASRILQRKEKPVITFEWNRVTSMAFGYEPSAISTILEQSGYQMFLATEKGLTPFKERTDIDHWTPMVWALTEDHRQELRI